jgi:hypothetical protein
MPFNACALFGDYQQFGMTIANFNPLIQRIALIDNVFRCGGV